MKYLPRKVFIIENNEYIEITYDELCYRKENIPPYKYKKFLPMHGMLMEVSQDVYRDFYKNIRRQQYITEQSISNGDVSYDALDNEDYNGEEILADPTENVPEQVERKIMRENLTRVLLLLPKDEEKLIREHFFEGISQVELGKMYGIDQSNISRKIKKILKKLKNFLEN